MTNTTGGEKPEYNDTGLWRQVIIVSSQRLRSWIISRDKPNTVVNLEADVKWDDHDDNLLHNIEEAVYDNPLLLDDFATDILIYSPEIIAIPQEAIDSSEDAFDSFAAVYGKKNDGIFLSDLSENICLAYGLCQGLTSFLGRTFPGARISHYLEPAIKHYSKNPGGATRLYVDLHDSNFDIWALRKGKLTMLASRKYNSVEDIAYFVFAIFKAWNLNSKTDEVLISGTKSERVILMPILRKNINYVTLTLLPGFPNRDDYPLPLILLLKNYLK